MPVSAAGLSTVRPRHTVHPTAFRRLLYASASTAERESIWNSRDGFAPLTVAMRDGSTGRRVYYDRVDPAAEPFTPRYCPSLGERVIVDMTVARALELAAVTAELHWAEQSPAGDFTRQRFGSRDALEVHLQDLHLDAVHVGGCPDVVTVTSTLILAKEWF